MIRFERIKPYIPYVTSMLFVVLFVYAATSKLLDYQQFQVQLDQSPILNAYGDTVAWLVPVLELVVAFLLLFDKYRLFALYISLGLMSVFTTYILLILNFSDYIPCSCGGVLEDLGWTEHVVFNLVFMALAFFAILFAKSAHIPFHKKTT